jgi:hypothetical protein
MRENGKDKAKRVAGGFSSISARSSYLSGKMMKDRYDEIQDPAKPLRRRL